jgi:hypothetical protein
MRYLLVIIFCVFVFIEQSFAAKVDTVEVYSASMGKKI